MRFAVSLPNAGEPADLVRLGVQAERSGWDGFFLWDHMQLLRDMELDIVDPWVVLGAVAQATDRVRLGTLVTPLARRRPWKVAREVVTLDRLSGGRAVLGVGLGEPPEDDFGAFGDEADRRERGMLLDESLELVDPFLRGLPVDHRGRRYEVHAHLRPASLQEPRLPIWVAGTWPHPKPFRRAIRWDGFVPVGEGGRPLDAAGVAEVAGEMPDTHDLVVTAMDDTPASAYERAGATWLVRSAWPVPGWLEEFGETVRAGPA